MSSDISSPDEPNEPIKDVVVAGYNGNTRLKRSGVQIHWTKQMAKEWVRCEKDPIYFCEKYMKISSVDHGIIPFKMRTYQKKMLLSMVHNRDTIGVMCRQSGKTTTYVGFCTWFMLFEKEKTIGLLANKHDTALEILGRIQMAYEHLPKWMQHGVVTFNKGKFELENDCRIVAGATSSASIRGYSLSVLIIDEAAHVEHWDEFFTSVYPTISSGKTTKSIYVSTPNGLNHFYNMVDNAKRGKSSAKLFDVTWSQVPGRDETWKQRELENMNFNYDKFQQEYENEFLGSSGTLLSGTKLKELLRDARDPIREIDDLKIYVEPREGRNYYLVADVGRGKGLDYSAFSIFDCTEVPYVQVAAFRSNMLHPYDYTNIIYSTCMNMYKNAKVLVEINDIGQQISDTLALQLEYPHILCSKNMGAAGKVIVGEGGGGVKTDTGIRTTIVVKQVGCSLAKVLIEQDKILLWDRDTIDEFSTFSKKSEDKWNRYEAESGRHDDLVMGFVLFAWLTSQNYFKDETLTDSRTAVLKESKEAIEESFPMDIEIISPVEEWERMKNMVEITPNHNSLANDYYEDLSDYF
jgi:hypothetical protein